MYDKSILLEILLRDDCRTLDNNGKPYVPSALVYNTISLEMQARGSHITAKHVYEIIRSNRNGYRSLLLKQYGINDDYQLKEDVDNTSISENVNISTSSISMYSTEFNLIVSSENWQKMKPGKKIYGNRVYWVLKSGWCDIIAERLWQQQKLYCTFKFKKHNVHLNARARCYVFFRGSCVECAATIACYIVQSAKRECRCHF